MGCPSIHTGLSDKEALLVLEPYFLEARELFVAEGLVLVKSTRLLSSPAMHDSPRHFAGTTEDGREVHVAPEMVELEEHLVVGVMAHELGHAADFLYPGEFMVGREHGRETIIRRRRDEVTDTQWARWMRAWENRAPEVIEKTADLIAGAVWGKPIGYVGPCMLESFEGGVPRPRGLR